jgi:hypothetical protein
VNADARASSAANALALPASIAMEARDVGAPDAVSFRWSDEVRVCACSDDDSDGSCYDLLHFN